MTQVHGSLRANDGLWRLITIHMHNG